MIACALGLAIGLIIGFLLGVKGSVLSNPDVALRERSRWERFCLRAKSAHLDAAILESEPVERARLVSKADAFDDFLVAFRGDDDESVYALLEESDELMTIDERPGTAVTFPERPVSP